MTGIKIVEMTEAVRHGEAYRNDACIALPGNPNLVITTRLLSPELKINHVPTGYAVGFPRSMRHAIDAIHALSKLDIDWNADDPSLFREHSAAVGEIIATSVSRRDTNRTIFDDFEEAE